MKPTPHEMYLRRVTKGKRGKKVWRWQAVCSCGWRGEPRKRRGAARGERDEHLGGLVEA